MNPRPRVLAIVPFRANTSWLDQCLQSLAAQTRPPDAVTVIDLASGEAVEEVVAAHGRVSLVAASEPCSVDAAITRLATTSAFDTFLVQYAEDWATPDRLEQLLATAAETGAIAVGSSRLGLDATRGEEQLQLASPELHDRAVELRSALFSVPFLRHVPGDQPIPAPVKTVTSVRDILLFSRALPDAADKLPGDDRFALRIIRPAGTAVRSRPRRQSSTPREVKPPVFVVGGHEDDAAVLAWALSLHPAMFRVIDTSWLTDLAAQATSFATYPPGARLTGHDLSAPMVAVRAAFEAAVRYEKPFLAAETAEQESGTWVAHLPASRRAIAAACSLYPDARLIHVIRDIESVRASGSRTADRNWLEATLAILDVERFFNVDRCLRLPLASLTADPIAAMKKCLRFLSERDEPRCAWPYTALAAAPGDTPRVSRGPESMAGALSQALLAPGRPSEASAPELDALAALLSSPERPVKAAPKQKPASKGSKKKTAPVQIDIEACRRAVTAEVPPGNVVCVISRGDDQLLDLGEGITGWHFPRQADGKYSGHHPADSAAAIEHLEALRASGASFLLVPPPYGWWLEHYTDLRAHLQQQFRLVAADPAVGWLFDLRADTGLTELGTAKIVPLELPGLPEVETRPAGQDAGLPLVTVIMTTFNMERFVERAVRSLASQTYEPLEILVVDDASTDGTFGILKDLSNEIPNLRVLSQRRNGGTYVARNIGIRSARGTLITFNDADDLSHPDRIRRQVHLWKTRAPQPDETIVLCDYQRITETGDTVLNRGLLQRLSMQTPLVPKHVFDVIGVFDSVRMSADAEFIDRFRSRFAKTHLLHLKSALYFATVRNDSLTAAAGAESLLGDSEQDAARPIEDFLSEPRRRYLAGYQSWHQDREDQSRMDFPLRTRPFYTPEQHTRDVPPPSRVIAGMATFKGRLSTVEQAVQSVAAQVDTLYLHLNDYDEPPPGVCLPNVKVTTYAEYGDLNDVGKFLMLSQVNGNDFLVTVDDDIVYPPNYVEHLLGVLEQFGRSVAVGVHGVVLPWPMERFFDGRSVAHFRRAAEDRRFVDIVGTGTMAVHSSALTLSVEDFKAPGMCDLWFAAACKAQGVPRVMVERPEGWLRPLESDESLWATFGMNDQIQTRVALEHGPWGRDSLRHEAAGWAGDRAHDDFFWESFGLGSTTDFVMEHRTS